MKKLQSCLPEISVNKLKPLPFTPSKPSPRPSTTTTATKSFNSQINRLSSQGEHHQVIRTYTSMINSYVPPDAFTYPNLLKACTSLHLQCHGLLFHLHVIVSGLASDPYIATSLIPFYSKFGRASIARKVFDMMPDSDRNIVPWTAIIGCYARTGDINHSFFMCNKMQSEGIKPASATIVAMLPGITEVSCVSCLHSLVVKYGFDDNLVLLNCMLSAYGKCGTIEDAENLFNSMNNKDLVTWNTLVSMYASVGDTREILTLLNRMKIGGVEPNQQTFTSLAVISKEHTVKLGKTVHGLILTSGFQSSAHVETSIMSMYLKHGYVNDALRIFERAEDKDVVIWTAMISGLVLNEYGGRAVEMFRQMLCSGVMPSTATIASALAACAQVASHQWGTSLHGYIMRQGMPKDIPSQNALVTMYAKCGFLEQSFVVFRMMEERDVVSWNAIVAAHAQNGNLREALFLFNEMRMALEQPDSITVVSLLQACASIGAYQQGKWIHTFVVRNYLGPCIMVDTALVDMYCKCGNLDIAKKCFDSMSQHDAVSWSTIIAGYGSHGQGEAALEVYFKALRDGFRPNATIFLSILYACSHNGLVDQGMSLFESMVSDFRIEPELEHRGCIVDLLCRAGRVEDAYNFYNRMFPEPAVDVLGILLDACRAKGKAELADLIGKEISLLNPADPGKYVQLAHSYAAMANWDGVGEAWGQMRSLGLKKIPGWSFIELHGTIVTFFRGHIYQPRYEDITLVLNILSNEINELLSSSNHEDFIRDSEIT